MLTSPSPKADPEEIADHLELVALTDPDTNSSTTQITAEFDISGAINEFLVEEDETGGELEGVADAAFTVVDDRSRTCGQAYPFSLDKSCLLATKGAEESLYVFLLLLSFFKGKAPNHKNAAKLFEEISALAACGYLGTDPIKNRHVFGFPRTTQPSGFKDALEKLCNDHLKEGEPRLDDPLVPSQKDGRLDVVVWKDFSDRRKSRIIVLGQCATGEDWEEKALALRPYDWSKKWLRTHFLPDPLPGFFVPHYILDKSWRHISIDGGLLFDRFRIASLAAPLINSDVELPAKIAKWNLEALTILKQARD